MKTPTNYRTMAFVGALALLGALFFNPLSQLVEFVLDEEQYSHIALIPLISLFFLFQQRTIIFTSVASSLLLGTATLLLGLILYGLSIPLRPVLDLNDAVSLSILAAIIMIWGCFLLFWGRQSFVKAFFPLAFLLFCIPIPTQVVAGITLWLQHGSAEVTDWMLKVAHIPFIRDGLTFHLTTMSIIVAEECSGIRSSIAILITAVIAGKLMLRSGWSRLAIALIVLPISFFKNGARIATLAYLASKVDTRFVTNSFLHHDGGMFFFALGLLAMFPLIGLLRLFERRNVHKPKSSINLLPHS